MVIPMRMTCPTGGAISEELPYSRAVLHSNVYNPPTGSSRGSVQPTPP